MNKLNRVFVLFATVLICGFVSAAYAQKPLHPDDVPHDEATVLKALAKTADITVSSAGLSAVDAYSKYAAGVLKESEGKYAEALTFYQEALALDPSAVEVYRDAIKSAMRTGKMDIAEKYSAELNRLQPDNADNLALSGMVNWGHGRIPEAIADYERALKLEPENADAIYQLSLLLRDSEPQRSLDYLTKYAELNENERPRAYYEIAVLKMKLKDAAGAEEYFRKAADFSPEFIQPRYALGQLYEIRSDTEAAIAVYSEVLKVDPKNAKLNVKIGELYLAMDKVPEAEAYFLRAVELDKSESTANYWLAAIAEERHEYGAAAEYLKNSSDYAESPSLVMRRSLYLTQDHRVPEAVETLGAAYAKWPDISDIAYFYSLGLTDMKQYDKAFDVLAKLCAKEPDNVQALIQYGIAAERLNKMDVMESSFDTVLSTQPNNSMVLNYMGYALADRGLKLDKAQELVERAVKIDGENGAYQDSLGWIQYKRGQYQQALETIKNAARSNPYDPEIWAHMGAVYSVLGSSGPAWVAYRMAYVLEPSLPDLTSKAKAVFERVPDADKGSVYLTYLAGAHGRYEKYAALCNVTLETGGETAQFKGILTYEPQAGISLGLTGPMFTPVWKAEISSGGVFSHDMSETMGFESEKLDGIARDMMRILNDYYSGGMFKSGVSEFSSGWGGDSLNTGKYKLGFDKQGDTVESVKFSEGGEISLRLEGYSRFGLHMIPRTLEFKRLGFKVRISVVKDNPSFAVNGDIIPN